jgi:short-subunit dehydrogenase
MRFKDQVAFITGASSGIGAALAREFAAEGAHLVLGARRKERLEDLAKEIHTKYGTKAIALECDVTRDGDLEKAVSEAERELGRIDIVVANAGYSVLGRLEELSMELYRKQFETNVFGVLRTVYATLGALKKTRGRLVLIGSIAGHVSIPGNTAYSMSKNAIRGLAEGLSHELSYHGISVTHIMPGFVGTEIFSINNNGKLMEKPEFLPPKLLIMPAETAARQIARATYRRRRERIITLHAKAVALTKRLFPGLVRIALTKGP